MPVVRSIGGNRARVVRTHFCKVSTCTVVLLIAAPSIDSCGSINSPSRCNTVVIYRYFSSLCVVFSFFPVNTPAEIDITHGSNNNNHHELQVQESFLPCCNCQHTKLVCLERLTYDQTSLPRKFFNCHVRVPHATRASFVELLLLYILPLMSANQLVHKVGRSKYCIALVTA